MTRHIRTALVAPKQTGKSTFARTLETWYGFHHTSLADPIKFSIIHAVNSFLTDQGIEPLLTPADLVMHKDSFRQGMQWLGTDIVRDLCGRPTHWIENLLNRVSAIEAHAEERQITSAIVIDDVRFVNEAEALRERGFEIIRLFRNDEMSPDLHKSETEMFDIRCDEVIYIGDDPSETIEQAKDFGLVRVESSLRLAAAQGSPVAQEWINRFDTLTKSEIQQELRKVSGVYGLQVTWR